MERSQAQAPKVPKSDYGPGVHPEEAQRDFAWYRARLDAEDLDLGENTDIWDAWEKLQTYKAELPTLFSMNEILMVSDELHARVGTLTAGKEWFKPWKTMEDQEAGTIIREPAMNNPTIVVLTDRNDQLFGTLSRCQELLRQDPSQAARQEGTTPPPVTGIPNPRHAFFLLTPM